MLPFEDSPCFLCPRQCGVNRSRGELGRCGMGHRVKIARATLHFWEEPPISGTNGSGTVFFPGCPLSCVYCQNREIAHEGKGREIDKEQLSRVFLRLQKQGAHNINLVTATHFLPTVVPALLHAKEGGLTLPVVFNTSGYETAETIRRLDGIVDIYLTDFRYYANKTAQAYSDAPDYPEVAKAATAEMVRLCGAPDFDENGIMRRGVIVRLLLLPEHLLEAKLSLHYLHKTYGDRILLSLMRQYTPMPDLAAPLNRRVSEAEYLSFVREAREIGVTGAFTQDEECIGESFIPAFDGSGLDAKEENSPPAE